MATQGAAHRPHVAVVGRGLIGSAAARHLARSGCRVTLVGGTEPQNWGAHQGSFASHYDEGRITRKNDANLYFVEVSAAAIARYAQIEAESGLRFFSEVGALIAGREPYMARVAAAGARAAAKGIAIARDALDTAALRARFPHMAFDEGITGMHEPRAAGHVSPRRLVAAQTEAARRHGARIVNREATRIAPGRVETAGETITADEVLVAAGGWTDSLLGRNPALTVYARTVALMALSEAEGHRLAALPSIVLDDAHGIYALPPIRYPDGRLWLKIGGDPIDRVVAGRDEINAWFRGGGDPAVRDVLVARMRDILPGLAIDELRMAPCVTSFTQSGLPEIRRLAPGLCVATGGNGAGAKCSDELGRRAALNALGHAARPI